MIDARELARYITERKVEMNNYDSYAHDGSRYTQRGRSTVEITIRMSVDNPMADVLMKELGRLNSPLSTYERGRDDAEEFHAEAVAEAEKFK